jgi:NAD+ synthase (glutamine-hydrolysing)
MNVYTHRDLLRTLNNAFRSGQQGRYNEVADENIQARLRDLYIMHFSNAFGALPLATGNKTEAACGYYTHFDMSFGYAPISDLYKLQVYQLARADERIPREIIERKPSAELSEGQTDEESLLPYDVLDQIVEAYIEKHIGDFATFKKQSKYSLLDANEEDYKRIIRLISINEYKRRMNCPGTKVSKVAFGIGRRIPITKGW